MSELLWWNYIPLVYPTDHLFSDTMWSALPRLNGLFMNIVAWVLRIYTYNMKTTASAVSFSAILSYEILDLGQQLSLCVDSISEGKATE